MRIDGGTHDLTDAAEASRLVPERSNDQVQRFGRIRTVQGPHYGTFRHAPFGVMGKTFTRQATADDLELLEAIENEADAMTRVRPAYSNERRSY